MVLFTEFTVLDSDVFFFIFLWEFPYCTSIQLNPCPRIRSVTLRDPQASTFSGSAICPHEAEGCWGAHRFFSGGGIQAPQKKIASGNQTCLAGKSSINIFYVLLIYDWGIPIATFDYRMVSMLEDCRVLRGVNKTWFYAVAGGFKHVAAISGIMIPNDAMTFISLFFFGWWNHQLVKDVQFHFLCPTLERKKWPKVFRMPLVELLKLVKFFACPWLSC